MSDGETELETELETALAYRKFDKPETKNQWQIFSTTDDLSL
ncbi:hypothetical protein ACED23_10655 [Vibrio splendidus]|uniref:Uncharacterized protein n=1 Tax=Vibrio splendidus TaxID=29497 RepID=A0ABV4LU39_VIBSP